MCIRDRLWQGGNQSHHGTHYTVENARIYTLPEEPTPIYIGASGPKAAALAGQLGDGLVGVGPEKEVVQIFSASGGTGKPRYGQMTVCWAEDEAAARKTAHDLWAFSSIPGEASQELPTPAHFDQVTQIVTEEMVAESVVCGPDPEKHLAQIQKYVEAGFDHVYVHQVGPDQAGFIDFYRREILSKFQ